MKTFTLLLVLMASAAIAQPGPYPGYFQLPVNAATKRVEYTGVVPVANAPEEELYARAQAWLAELGSTHTVVHKVSHPEAGALITHVKTGNAFDSKAFRLAIQVKDGQYQYRIDQITHTQSDYARAGKYSLGTVTTNMEAYGLRRQRKEVIKTIDKIDRWILATIDGLNGAMKRPEEAGNLI